MGHSWIGGDMLHMAYMYTLHSCRMDDQRPVSESGSESDGSWADWPDADPEKVKQFDEEMARRAAVLEQRRSNGDWCRCSGCFPITHAESASDVTCCQESEQAVEVCQENDQFGNPLHYSCITQHFAFTSLCLYVRLLDNLMSTAFKEVVSDMDEEEEEPANRNLLRREAALRSYVLWVHGYNTEFFSPKEIPQCVRAKIWKRFPLLDSQMN